MLFEVFDDPIDEESSRIVITEGQIEFLKASYARTRQRTPSEEELAGLVDSYLREEILYREALALGLDKNDPVIRNRLRQKLELMSDDLAGIVIPTDEQLQQFLESNPDKFNTEPQIAFRHVFIDVTQRGLTADDEAVRILSILSENNNSADPDSLGDRLMQPKSFGLTPVSEITKLFGKPFSFELTKMVPGQWSGPIQSGYGLHLIFVTDHVAARLPRLDEIQDTVEWEWSAASKKELKENIYKGLREKYTIVIEHQKGGGNNAKVVPEVQAAQEDLL